MAIRVVRLGSERLAGEGLRLGTVRRPPRGVPKSDHASGNWYDLWLPMLAPSAETVALGRDATSDADWARFVRAYRREMAAPEPAQAIALLAALSHASDFSVGCYCEDEARCHRGLLRELLAAQGARMA
jgi:uncharacterized protein YeaO (DUF488 family)